MRRSRIIDVGGAVPGAAPVPCSVPRWFLGRVPRGPDTEPGGLRGLLLQHDHQMIRVSPLVLHALQQFVDTDRDLRSEEHTSELQSHSDLVCRLLLEKKKHYNVH